jgi:hypothetical protein
MLVGQYPNQSEIPVNLNQGLYIVQAGNKSAKLLVNTNRIGGGTTVQPVLETPTAYASPPPEINLRAGGGIKIYWNITTGNSVVPVEIFEVVNFKFTTDNSIVFTLKNGTTVELENYQGIEFSIEPAPVTTTSQWDMEKTLKFGGASYWNIHLLVYEPPQNFMCVTAVSTAGVITHFFPNNYLNGEIAFPNSARTYSGFWGLDGRLTVVKDLDNNVRLCKVMSDRMLPDWLEYVAYDSATGENDYSTRKTKYSFNAGTPSLPTIIKIVEDGGMYMKFTSFGKDYEYTFPIPK